MVAGPTPATTTTTTPLARRTHGGARRGAGRKATRTADYQLAMRALVEEEVSDERWRLIVHRAIAAAAQGDHQARLWLTPWVLGAAPRELKLDATATITYEEAGDQLTDAQRQAVRLALAGTPPGVGAGDGDGDG